MSVTTANRRSTRRRGAAMVAVVVVLGLAAAGCGSSSSSSSSGAAAAASGTSTQVSHAKTKFVLHAGLAFGAFHHWIYLPLKAGDFSHPLLHKLTVVKAGVAGLYVYHELKLALGDAQGDATLSKLVAPITALEGKIQSVAADIKGGHPNPAAITQANGLTGSIGQLASGAGQPISDIVPSSL